MEERAVRLREPNRSQMVLQPTNLDELIGPEHDARAIWRMLGQLDLSEFHTPIRARESLPGRDASDPRMLLALWLYGISQGVNSARELERRCQAHAAYRWICGAVPVNYHTLSDFRTTHQAALELLFDQLIATLMHQGLVTLERVAQDGTRVRASAGSSSFRRRETLERCLKEAREHRQAVEQQPPDLQQSARAQAAQQRAAREREQHCTRALAELQQLRTHKQQAKNHPQRLTATRSSTTDPEARVMKLADGGYAPAYNLQFATDTQSRLIVGVRTTNSSADSNQLEPMLQDLERRCGRTPGQHLGDGGYLNLQAVEYAAARGTAVFVPPRSNRSYHIDPFTPQPRDSPAIAEYRLRMGSAQGRQIYQQRGAVAETVNADLKAWRGLDRLRVRGLIRVNLVALLTALTYNLLRCIRMRWL